MQVKLSLLSILFLVSFTLHAQPAAYNKAKAAFLNGEFSEAAQEGRTAYERISIKNKKARSMKSEMAYVTAYSYQNLFNNQEAEAWFQRAIDLRYFNEVPEVYFKIANIQRQRGDYESARYNYQEYLKLVPGDQRAERALEGLDKAVVLKDNRTRYTIKNEFKINTENMEMATAIGDRRGNLIVFGSTRKAPHTSGKDPILGEPYFNIWQAEIDRNGNWTEPVPFVDGDSINTEYNEGTIAFDGRFRKMFITRCPNEDKQNLGCQIWMSERRGRNWGIPTRLRIQEHDTLSVGHPAPTESGDTLIFAGDLPGGMGGMDLWYTVYTRRSDSWSTPINLGPEINTAGDELFPTFALNGDLLFSSNGHPGLGGLDLFRAEKIAGESFNFGTPRNLGTPLNSDLDDFHITEIDERNGYFSSNRKGSKGTRNMSDIWSYELPPSIFDLRVVVNEVGENNRVAGATVEVTAGDGNVFRGVTNSDGEIYWDKKADGERLINEKQTYTIRVLQLEGYHPSNETSEISTIGLQYDQNFIVEMALLPKTPIVLPEVRYDLGSAVLQVIDGVIDSRDSLNYVFNLLEEYPGMVLKLASHTDSRGSATSNEALALARAQSCVDYLVKERGVHPERLVAVGKGENEPRTIYMTGDTYLLKRPTDGAEYEKIELTEQYINQFKADSEKFERLHQYNRRTEAEVVRMDWTPSEPKEN